MNEASGRIAAYLVLLGAMWIALIVMGSAVVEDSLFWFMAGWGSYVLPGLVIYCDIRDWRAVEVTTD